MFIRRLFILLIVGFSLEALSAGNEQITGAFCIVLGDQYDPKRAYGKKSKETGLTLYSFRPKNNFRSFTKYAVSLTPSTKKIFLINALAVFRNSSDCESELDLMSSMLGEKYGQPIKTTDRFDLNNTTVLIDQPENGREILLKCSRLRSNVKLDIFYSDNNLQSLADQEYKEIERERLDDSGL
jgi:hypothetical protein